MKTLLGVYCLGLLVTLPMGQAGAQERTHQEVKGAMQANMIHITATDNPMNREMEVMPDMNIRDQEGWDESLAIQPEELANRINSGDTENLIILNIGWVNDIKGAVHIGPVSQEENLIALKKYLQKLPVDQELVFYCGCCHMAFCLNVLPAYEVIRNEGFTNFRVMDIDKNLSVDWINKGYPMDAKDQGGYFGK